MSGRRGSQRRAARHRKMPRGAGASWARSIRRLPDDELLVVRLVEGNGLYAWVCTFDHFGQPVMSWSMYAFEWRDDAATGAEQHWFQDHGGRAPGLGYRFLRPGGS
jgi:hypothetical protein